MHKLGRNEPCSCGSGKKYKQCCLSVKVFSMANAMAEALKLHNTGDFSKAEALYLTILQHQADEPDALHLLGVLYYQQRAPLKALPLLEKSVRIRPSNSDYLNHLGLVYRDLKRLDEALACYRKAFESAPKDVLILNNLGTLFNDMGSTEKAIISYRKALEYDHKFVDAWNNLGHSLLNLDQVGEAAHCFKQVLKIDPHNEMAGHMVSALTGKQTERAPNLYIESTFDHYAEKFDAHLIESLQYDAPKKLVELIQKHKVLPLAQVLDLGCGTGLVGQEIAPIAQTVIGVDLSGNMLDKAREKNVYHGLHRSDLLPMMKQEKTQSYDAIIASDVLVYFGKLDEVLSEIARLLQPRGLLAFTLEVLESDDSAYRLNSTGRYAHSAFYLNQLATDQGFKIQALETAVTRIEKGGPVHSWLNLWIRLEPN